MTASIYYSPINNKTILVFIKPPTNMLIDKEYLVEESNLNYVISENSLYLVLILGQYELIGYL